EEPDVSNISKVAEGNRLEELDDSFDHPLHSTAVDAFGEEHSENESRGHVSAPQRRSTAGSGSHDTFSMILEFKIPEFCNDELYSVVSVDSSCSIRVWCPKKMKRSHRDITELDVVLTEFEKITANYRQGVASDICRKAIDGFSSAFKDQITGLILEIQELKNMKKKNAKVLTDIKKKRQHLFQLREEQIGAEPQLTELEREYAELQERKSSLRNATDLLTDIKELQQDYLDYREENSEVVYGTSSLPALLLESRRILGAEKHFQNINMKLEEALGVQRRK
ncbi:CENPU protein, partial [Alcedo cyanopectus]|nr:CENPU protein [Ceyx cyanopectus]